MALKQEFRHHQEKVDQYNKLLEMSESLGMRDMSNDIRLDEEDLDREKKRHDNELSGVARDVKDNYDRLHRLATNTQSQEFEENRVQRKNSLHFIYF